MKFVNEFINLIKETKFYKLKPEGISIIRDGEIYLIEVNINGKYKALEYSDKIKSPAKDIFNKIIQIENESFSI